VPTEPIDCEQRFGGQRLPTETTGLVLILRNFRSALVAAVRVFRVSLRRVGTPVPTEPIDCEQRFGGQRLPTLPGYSLRAVFAQEAASSNDEITLQE
jgi:hypothetical protein